MAQSRKEEKPRISQISTDPNRILSVSIRVIRG